jgi:hypothetical protein
VPPPKLIAKQRTLQTTNTENHRIQRPHQAPIPMDRRSYSRSLSPAPRPRSRTRSVSDSYRDRSLSRGRSYTRSRSRTPIRDPTASLSPRSRSRSRSPLDSREKTRSPSRGRSLTRSASPPGGFQSSKVRSFRLARTACATSNSAPSADRGRKAYQECYRGTYPRDILRIR